MAPAQEAAHPRARPLVTVRGHAEGGEAGVGGRKAFPWLRWDPRLAPPSPARLTESQNCSQKECPAASEHAEAGGFCPSVSSPSSAFLPRLARCREHGRLS